MGYFKSLSRLRLTKELWQLLLNRQAWGALLSIHVHKLWWRLHSFHHNPREEILEHSCYLRLDQSENTFPFSSNQHKTANKQNSWIEGFITGVDWELNKEIIWIHRSLYSHTLLLLFVSYKKMKISLIKCQGWDAEMFSFLWRGLWLRASKNRD